MLKRSVIFHAQIKLKRLKLLKFQREKFVHLAG